MIPAIGDIGKLARVGRHIDAVRAAVGASRRNKLESVYRVYGGDSKPAGFSWTPIHPGTVSDFRSAAGLPSGGDSGAFNSGRFVVEGLVRQSDIIKRRTALPLDGYSGGPTEYIIDPNHVTVTRVSGANPDF